MTCNGLCEKYKSAKPSNNTDGRYALGQKRCTICSIFMIWDGISCPCCNVTLRIRPRNSINRKSLQKHLMIQRI